MNPELASVNFLDALKKFICEAHKNGYALGDQAGVFYGANRSNTIVYDQGDWRYEDTYHGNGPFVGYEIVLYRGEPVWGMSYYGHGAEGEDAERIYSFLREMLLRCPESFPLRGPLGRTVSSDGKWMYVFTDSPHSLQKFCLEESISALDPKTHEVRKPGAYVGHMAGGLVGW